MRSIIDNTKTSIMDHEGSKAKRTEEISVLDLLQEVFTENDILMSSLTNEKTNKRKSAIWT